MIKSQRFRKGEIFCYCNPFYSSLPICAKNGTGKFVRLYEDFLNWSASGHELFYKIPTKKLCFGFVCDYELETFVIHTDDGRAEIEVEEYAFFGMLFVDERFQMVRLKDSNECLWKFINFDQELVQNYKGGIVALHHLESYNF